MERNVNGKKCCKDIDVRREREGKEWMDLAKKVREGMRKR